MVAGATSCTCGECGAACTGKFYGCADVWARGPRLVAVRSSTFGRGHSGGHPTADDGTAGPHTAVPDDAEVTGHTGGGDRLRTLLDELVVRCEGLEAGAAKIDALAAATADARATREAVAAVGRSLEDLSTRLAPLEALPARLDELETVAAPAPLPAGDDLFAVVRGFEGLEGRLSSLEAIAERVGSLDQERSRLAALDKILAGLVQGSVRLAGRVEALEAAPIPEVAAPVPVVDHAPALKVLADRVGALETTPTVEPRIPARLVAQMERLVSQVAALEQTPDRMAAVERSVEALSSGRDGAGRDRELHGITSHLERLAAEVASQRAVPKRVEAIERTQGRIKAIDKTLATLSHRIDDLSNEVAATTTPTAEPETPPRVEALEAVVAELVQSVGQFSALVAGLDEVPKRVEALEQAATPSERIVTSLAKRVDRLSTQAASVKDLTPRLKALEQAAADSTRMKPTTEQVEGIAGDVALLRTSLDGLVARLQRLESAPAVALDQPPDRTDALIGGLGHAIDMIDQLAHQVAVLEQAPGADPSQPPA